MPIKQKSDYRGHNASKNSRSNNQLQLRSSPDCFAQNLLYSDVSTWIFPNRRAEDMKGYCEALGLWEKTSRLWSKKPHCDGHKWEIKTESLQELRELPPRLEHAGKYEWIGKEDEGLPKWLWDSHESRTVPADKRMLSLGYIAVSYTWGRWAQPGKIRRIKGVPWDVPVVKSPCCDIEDLLLMMQSIPGYRYYWIDVLCIDQGKHSNEERMQEIAKQGSIFAKAKGVLIYTWSIPNGKELKLALSHLGDTVLQSLHPVYENGSHSEWQQGGAENAASILQDDHWFTSLWTMQEMVMCPSGVIVARNGDYCTINRNFATIALVASAISVTDEMTLAREFIRKHAEVSDWKKHMRSNSLYKKLVEAHHNMQDDRNRGIEKRIRAQTLTWKEWNDQCSLDICLTADRPGILFGAAKRQAKERRGEAVIAALKVGRFDGAFDENGLTPSGLPSSLLNKILEFEGRRLFNNFAVTNSSVFFTDMIPSSATVVSQIIPAKEWIPAAGWSIADDGSVRIPRGSSIQRLESGTIYVRLFSEWKSTAVIADEILGYIQTRHSKWGQRGLFDDGISEDLPQTIDQIILLPLYRTGDNSPNTALPTMLSRLEFGSRYPGLNKIPVDGASGILLGSCFNNSAKEQRWYNCGTYLALSFKEDKLHEDIVVGGVESLSTSGFPRRLLLATIACICVLMVL